MKGDKIYTNSSSDRNEQRDDDGCFKPSKDAVVESKYYQSLKDERDKLSVQLKEERKNKFTK